MNEVFHTIWVQRQLQHWHLKALAVLETPRCQASTSRHPVAQLPLAAVLAPADIPRATTERLYQPSRGQPRAGHCNSQTSLQPPLHAISPSLNIIPQNLPLNTHNGARMWENGLKPPPSRRNPMPSSLQPLPGVRDANRRCRTAFTGVAFLQGLNTCVICAVLASLRLVFLRLLDSLFLAKQQIFY